MSRLERAARSRWAVVVVVAALLGLFVWMVRGNVEKVQTEQTAVSTQQALVEVADPLAQLCADDPSVRARVGAACEKAAQASTAAAEKPHDGLDGKPGVAGRGITATMLDSEGHLILTFTDGSTQDVGQVVGAAGKDGAVGAAGTGIVSAATVNGHLILTFSDGTTVDVGQVVGQAGQTGRGVKSTAAVNGRLIVTYSDGTTEDAGALPMGPPAPPAGQLVINREDGTTVTCDRSGGADSAPVYTCQSQ
jgi:hypothetical protein